jgi:hypothetical protein
LCLRTLPLRQVECAFGRSTGAAAVATPRPNLILDEGPVADWVYAQKDSAEELAQLQYFSFKKQQPGGEVEFVITVKEFAPRNELQMRFYAQADKEVNQRTAAFRPFGWGDSLLGALRECLQSLRQYPYEPD